MNPKLEEIRRRLLAPSSPSTPPRYGTQAGPGQVLSGTLARPPEQTAVDSRPTDDVEESATKIHSSPEDKELGAAGSDEVTSPVAPLREGLAQAVAELFEPARQCQRRLLEIIRTSKAIGELKRLALELRDPLNSFHDNIRKLSSSFESMRSFRDELGELAESFAPVRPLHQQMIEMAHSVRVHLALMAAGLKPAKALKLEIAELAAAIDSLSELQDRFYDLSKAFGDAHELRADEQKAEAVPHSPPNEAK